ncbi:MAG: class I SAM-dependent rRNA methyltransferase [Phycisphaerales bacterium]|nr:class I SAM-dependent rRNA methyltransferase [Phycisphaerales bacterium]
MKKILLRKNISNRIQRGHCWIYNNEIGEVESAIAPGSLVAVYYHHRGFCGIGYYNAQSQITIRLLTRKQEIIDDAFFYRKINTSWIYRKKLGIVENARVVFGEADGLPALIVDKFNDYLVVQILSLGMEQWRDAIVKALTTIFNPKGIYQRNDVPVRTLEGLSLEKTFLSDPFNTNIIINEHSIQMNVDLSSGQKTGYFLDQQHNRTLIAPFVKDATVLGAFCYTGSFELHAAYYGARSVLGIDISDTAIEAANNNARLNGLEDICTFKVANAFDELKKRNQIGETYDVVMIDPPSFSKNRININKALSGYKEVNLRAMKLIRSGGFLVSSSCTGLVSSGAFMQMIESAAIDAKKQISVIHFLSQSPDHPIVVGLENTQYLKFLIAQVVDR